MPEKRLRGTAGGEYLIKMDPDVADACTAVAKIKDFHSRNAYIRYVLKLAINGERSDPLMDRRIRREVAKLKKQRAKDET